MVLAAQGQEMTCVDEDGESERLKEYPHFVHGLLTRHAVLCSQKKWIIVRVEMKSYEFMILPQRNEGKSSRKRSQTFKKE